MKTTIYWLTAVASLTASGVTSLPIPNPDWGQRIQSETAALLPTTVGTGTSIGANLGASLVCLNQSDQAGR